ncbi:nucleotidyltransferase domain-containing protein [Candidatus Amesbacteria bacterium]|nr:nucleotidyltransferase domain-containing protein [Candidatus Amesbacteria bacterium]
MLTDNQKLAIREYLQNKPVEVLYLFGSQATGTARPDSDYDFGAIFSNESSLDNRLKLMAFLSNLLKNDHIDVLDLKKVPIRFQYEAIFPRDIIFVRNIQFVKDFEYNILTHYFDEMYFMKQMTRDYMQQFVYD